MATSRDKTSRKTKPSKTGAGRPTKSRASKSQADKGKAGKGKASRSQAGKARATKGKAGRGKGKGKAADPEAEAAARRERRRRKRQGIWEVARIDGAILGLFEGTPEAIGAWLCANQTKAVKGLEFQLRKVQAVPDEVARERCCNKRLTKRDNFCSICGQPKRVDPVIPKGVKVEIDLG